MDGVGAFASRAAPWAKTHIAAALAASARAGEHVRAPAYNPPIGHEILYRVTVSAMGEY